MFKRFKSWIKTIFVKPVYIEAPKHTFPEPVGVGPELPDPRDKGSVKLAIIVGHEKTKPGAKMAEPYGKHEYQYNTIVANKIMEFARISYPLIDVVIIFRDGVGISGAYAKARALLCDVAIELHFNAFDGKATGTSTLCTPDHNDVEFAQVIQKAMCKVFKREGDSRGVHCISKSARGGGNVHSFPGGANCLVEPFFGDNQAEAALGMEHCDEYAEALVRAVYLWGKSVDLLH